MTTMATSDDLCQRLNAVYARGRVAEALLGIALDVLEPYASEYLSRDDYNRLCELVGGPVRSATEKAMVTLLDELAPVVQSADPRVAYRLRDHTAG